MNTTKATGESHSATEELKNHVLTFTWSTSKGRDTFGYNLLTLRENGEKVASTCGGGYDMMGTVLADWLEKAYPSRLLALAMKRAGTIYSTKGNIYRTSRYLTHQGTRPTNRASYALDPNYSESALSGLAYNKDTGTASLDGGCGQRCVEEAFKALGLELKADQGNWNHKTGRSYNKGVYIVSPIKA